MSLKEEIEKELDPILKRLTECDNIKVELKTNSGKFTGFVNGVQTIEIQLSDKSLVDGEEVHVTDEVINYLVARTHQEKAVDKAVAEFLDSFMTDMQEHRHVLLEGGNHELELILTNYDGNKIGFVVSEEDGFQANFGGKLIGLNDFSLLGQLTNVASYYHNEYEDPELEALYEALTAVLAQNPKFKKTVLGKEDPFVLCTMSAGDASMAFLINAHGFLGFYKKDHSVLQVGATKRGVEISKLLAEAIKKL